MGNILSVIGSPMIASNKAQLQFSIQTTKLTQTNILIHHAIYANTLLVTMIIFYMVTFIDKKIYNYFFVISNLNLSNMFNNTTTTTTSATKDTISGQPEAIL